MNPSHTNHPSHPGDLDDLMTPTTPDLVPDVIPEGRDLPLPRRKMLAALGLGAAFSAPALAGVTQSEPPPAGGAEAGARAGVLTARELGWDAKTGRYVLPKLPYDYDALEKAIDSKTVHVHHDDHHAAYVQGLNKALDELRAIRRGRRDPRDTRRWTDLLAFNASGHFLHVLYWHCMSADAPKPTGLVLEMIERDFESHHTFTVQFTAAATLVQGSGWGILAFEPISRRLVVLQAEKHQNLGIWGVVPLLAVDVWEHAYYLRYRHRRKKYVDAFMQIINWDFVNRKLETLVAAPST